MNEFRFQMGIEAIWEHITYILQENLEEAGLVHRTGDIITDEIMEDILLVMAKVLRENKYDSI